MIEMFAVVVTSILGVSAVASVLGMAAHRLNSALRNGAADSPQNSDMEHAQVRDKVAVPVRGA